MVGNDVEKLPTLSAVNWPRRGKRCRGKTRISLIFFCLCVVWVCYLLLDLWRKSSSSTALKLRGPALSDASSACLSSISIKKLSKADSAQRCHIMTDYQPSSATDVASSLAQLLSLDPHHLQTKALLQPIDSTGEARLYEIGVRTRYFKKVFEAWEKVQLILGHKGNDLAPYLRLHPEIPEELGMTTLQVLQSYEEIRSIFSNLSALLFSWTAPYHPDHIALHNQFFGAGKGIVMLAGDEQIPFLLTSIRTIRQLGCDLPIEVFYYGDRDMSTSSRQKLEALSEVTTRDLDQEVDARALSLSGWAGKPFAILLSSFQHAIFIDADALFFQNPETLFEDEAYLRTGALFFKDRRIFPRSKREWLQDVLPPPIPDNVLENRLWTGESEHMQESGVVVVDKWRHFVAMLLVARLNGPDRDGDEAKGSKGVYDMVFGDKETFWLGWELAGDTDYAFHNGDTGTTGVSHPAKDIPGWNGDILIATSPPQYTICASQLLHLDQDGRPLWFNGWLSRAKYEDNAGPAVFERFLREPNDIRQSTAWSLHENNVCCLTSDYKADFTNAERDILDNMIATGYSVGAFNKVKDSDAD